ncbi:uncharacterized protein LOC110618847 [Manihot esculenta]|uniref:Late embryogenesis abundant protein LEA-2 subgroup domain-containing protein n=1 Tax=Manihot esculenta TaxID=3983 RepID=A0A2C9VHC0_MANES|nr:uncharacterized protein LOC110618847 [Manihot esculenta]OAY44794.1 hypothetical protein MANES_07G005900v8 [Manihot esculenta]
MATHRKMDSEDQETLFHSYPCAYYVQSPSTISLANSAELKTHNLESTFHSPSRSDTNVLLNKNPEVSRFTLSRYSSSHGSNNSFLNEKKINGDENGVSRLIIVDGHGKGGYGVEEEEEDDDEDYYYGRKGGWWWRYCSFRRSSSCAWVSLQICWRLLASLGVALLVFYIATKPPSPKLSIKMGGIQQFGLGEGVDGTGVTTKILSCNCSMNLLIENKSKLFGLHLQPPLMEMFFGRLPFAMSRGSKLYAESHGSTLFKLYVGTKNKPMYGAGRNMQDLLDSGNGLPILIRVRLSSHFRVIPNLINPKYHHQAECLLFLDSSYDKKHRTQAYNSTCTVS